MIHIQNFLSNLENIHSKLKSLNEKLSMDNSCLLFTENNNKNSINIILFLIN